MYFRNYEPKDMIRQMLRYPRFIAPLDSQHVKAS